MKSYRIMIFVIAGTALLASCKKLTYDLQDRSSGPYPVILAKNIESFKLMRMNGTLAYRLSGKITELTYEHKVRITPDELQKHLLDQMVVPAEVDLAGVECGAHRWAGRLPKIKKSLTGYDRITTVLPAVGIAVQVDISDGQRSFSYDGCTDEQGRVDISDDDLIEMYLKRFRSFPTRLVVESSARSPYPRCGCMRANSRHSCDNSPITSANSTPTDRPFQLKKSSPGLMKFPRRYCRQRQRR